MINRTVIRRPVTILALLLLVSWIPAAAAVHGGLPDALDALAPAYVFAEGDNQIGADGSNVTWSLEDVSGGKRLVISGSGSIDQTRFTSEGQSPWQDNKDQIVEVTVKDGITGIPSYFIYGMPSLKEICLSKDIKVLPGNAICKCGSLVSLRLPDGLETIKNNSIYWCEDLSKIYLPDSLTEIETYAFKYTSYVFGTCEYVGDYYVTRNNDVVMAFVNSHTYGSSKKVYDARCFDSHSFLVSRDNNGFHTICSVCGLDTENNWTFFCIHDIRVSDMTCTGRAVTPGVTVHYNGSYNELDSSYYDVRYENNVKAGTGYAVVTFKNGYSGTVKEPFVIEPAAPRNVRCSPITGGFRVYWDAPEGNADKYVVSYYNVFDGTRTKTVGGNIRSADILGDYTGQLCAVKVTACKTINGYEYTADSEEVESCFGGKAVAGAGNVSMPSKKTVTVGFKTQLTVNYDKFSYTLDNSKIKWSSSNKKIATVSSKGLVRAKKKGKCKIYCTYCGRKMTTKLTVGANEVKDYKYSELDPYSSYQRYVEIYPLKLSYNKKGKLVMKTALLNRRMFRADKFTWIRITVYDKKGKVIAKQKFRNVRINCKKYGKKQMTFTFNKGTKRKVDLRTQYDYETDDYYYTYSY